MASLQDVVRESKYFLYIQLQSIYITLHVCVDYVFRYTMI